MITIKQGILILLGIKFLIVETIIFEHKTKQELLEIVQKMLRKKREVERIAKAGQEKTLRCHTIERLFNEIIPAFNIRFAL